MEDAAIEPTVIDILIDDIVLVEEEKISSGKTTLAVGGGLGVIAFITTAIIFFPFFRCVVAK